MGRGALHECVIHECVIHSKRAVCVWYTLVWYRQRKVAFCRKLRSRSVCSFVDQGFQCLTSMVDF